MSGDIDFTTTSITFAQLGNFPSSIGQIRNDFMGFEALFINQNVAYLNKTQAGTSGAKHMALLDQTVRKAIHQAIFQVRGELFKATNKVFDVEPIQR